MTYLKVGGPVWVAPVGTEPSDPGWRSLGGISPGSIAFGYDGSTPKKLTTSYEFTFNTKPHSLDALSLYYGTDVKSAGIVINRGEVRKEEKHMGVRKFKSWYDVDIEVKGYEHGAQLGIKATHGVLLKHADVPLIAHALFEKSGWPTAKEDSVGDWEAETPAGSSTWGFKVRSDEEAAGRLLDIIANLAAYNAWHEGKAEREAAEAAKKAEAEAARRREHDELRTSAIALKALRLYNDSFTSYFSYESWDAVNSGMGTDDAEVRHWIAKAEAARAAKPAPKVGGRVRVSADAKTTTGGRVFFDGEVEGDVVGFPADNVDVKAPTSRNPKGVSQSVDPKYVTVVATAEDFAAEKAKAERDAGIAALIEVDNWLSPDRAGSYYDRGIRATA